ncbi:hypothetical protein GW796_08635 [archaeon]|nr:hypothetical protein [archaeon]NCQ51945.1 hypothetical protein [archaeon]
MVKVLKYKNIKDLESHHNHLLALYENPSLKKTLESDHELLMLHVKGLEYIVKLYKTNKLLNVTDLTNDISKKKLIEIGMSLEQKDFSFEHTSDVLLKTESHLKLEHKVKDFGVFLNLVDKNDLGDEFGIKKSKKPKKPKLDVKPQEKININEELLINELLIKAKMDGDIKEVKLEQTPMTGHGQVPSSLVVDLDVKKIENIVLSMDNKLNAKDDKSIEPSVKVENKTRLKNKLPKPTPNQGKKKLQENPKLNMELRIADLTKKLREQQENNPTILEQEKFLTVKAPQIQTYKNTNIVAKNIFSLREQSLSGINPSVVEDQFGLEEVKVVKRLKS